MGEDFISRYVLVGWMGEDFISRYVLVGWMGEDFGVLTDQRPGVHLSGTPFAPL